MTMASRLKVAMAQIWVEGGELEGNLARAEAAIAEGEALGADLVLLPECLDAGWTHPSSVELAAPIPGATCDRLARAAQAHGVHVVAGLTEQDGPRRYNAAVLLSDEGELLLKVRKVNVLDLARDLYDVGDLSGVAQTRFGRLGVNICADNFPTNTHLGRTLGWMGARAILSPSAWASDPEQPDLVGNPSREMWLEAYRALAHDVWIPTVAVSNVGNISGGVWQGRSCIGSSLAVSKTGELLAELGVGPEVRLVDVELGDHPAPVQPRMRPLLGEGLVGEGLLGGRGGEG